MIFRKWLKSLDIFDYSQFIDDLWNGLSGLSFNDNFKIKKVENLSLTAAVEETIYHNFGSIPSHKIITKQSEYARIKDVEWTKDYAKIISDADCIISILYFK